MPLFQVSLLLTLLAYLLLVALENPGLVRLPLPLGQGEWLLPTGTAVALFAVLGGLYVTLLLSPLLVGAWLKSRKLRRDRQALEQRLVETLGARLATVPSLAAVAPETVVPAAAGERETGA